jgi:hypothetical protein
MSCSSEWVRKEVSTEGIGDTNMVMSYLER